MQHLTDGVGRRKKVHGLLQKYDRDVRLASTFTCAGLGGCCGGGGAGEKCCSGGGAGERRKRLHRTQSEPKPKRKLGVYHWVRRFMIQRSRLTDGIFLWRRKEVVLVRGLNGKRRSCCPAETVFSDGGAGYGRVRLQRFVLASEVSRW